MASPWSYQAVLADTGPCSEENRWSPSSWDPCQAPWSTEEGTQDERKLGLVAATQLTSPGVSMLNPLDALIFGPNPHFLPIIPSLGQRDTVAVSL